MEDSSSSDLSGLNELDEGEQRKGEKKRLRKLQESFEILPLDSGERYRALTDHARLLVDIIELADRKTRFGLVILAALNTVNFVAVVRPDFLTGSTIEHGIGMAVYVALYATLSLYLCMQAIGALKPRLAGALKEISNVSAEQKWLNLLSLDTMPDIDADGYYELWRTATFGQLNREIAFRNQAMSSIVLQKYVSVGRLFSGLSILVIFTTLLILFLMYSRFVAD